MDTVGDLKRDANNYRKSNNYVAALPLYRKLWEAHRNECNEWDGWGYAYCLRKQERPAEAILICRELHKLYPDFEPMRELYGWSIYDTEISSASNDPSNVDEGRLLRAANFVLELTKPDSQYSPYVRTVLKVLDYYRARASASTAQLLAWTAKLKPEHLSTKTGRGTDAKIGRIIEYASDMEKWYSVRLKALLDDGQYQECIRVGNEALAQISKLHYDNDVWFRWRIALAHFELAELETAHSLFLVILQRKQDWFVQHRLAETLCALGRSEEALSYAVNAALAHGDLEHKWKLFTLMATLYQATDEKLARQHLLLAAVLHQEQGWKLPNELHQAVQESGVDPSNLLSSNDLYKELLKQWKATKFAGKTLYQGKISSILSHGNAAFIRGDNGEDYYFKTNAFKGPKHKLSEGQRVRFYKETNPNPNQRDTAISVEPI